MKKILAIIAFLFAQNCFAQPFPVDIKTPANPKGTMLILEGCKRTSRMESFWREVVSQANEQGWRTVRWSTGDRLGMWDNCSLTWKERFEDSLALQKWAKETFAGKVAAIGSSQGAVAVSGLSTTPGWDLLIALSPQCKRGPQPNGTSHLVIFTGDLDTTSNTEVCKTWNATKFIEPSAFHGWQYPESGPFTDRNGTTHHTSYNSNLSRTFWDWFKIQ